MFYNKWMIEERARRRVIKAMMKDDLPIPTLVMLKCCICKKATSKQLADCLNLEHNKFFLQGKRGSLPQFDRVELSFKRICY